MLQTRMLILVKRGRKRECNREKCSKKNRGGRSRENIFKQVKEEWEASKDRKIERWISNVVYPWLPACC